MLEAAVSLRRVRVDWRTFTLGPIDLELTPGRVCGLIGPNGAGKSTLLRVLMGRIRPDAGEARVLGRELRALRAEVMADVGVVTEELRLHPAKSLRWHADVVASLRPGWDESRARALAQRFELAFGQRGGEMSRGQGVKAMLLLALAARPKLLLLDEPTAGLDPLVRGEVLALLDRIVREEGLTVLFSSHLTTDVTSLADDVAFLHRGRLVAFDTCASLVRRGSADDDGAATSPSAALETLFRRLAEPEVAHAG